MRARGWQSQAQSEIATAQKEAAPWGLHAFEDPALPALQARPVWNGGAHQFVLEAEAEYSVFGQDCMVLDHFGDMVRLVVGAGVEHLLLSDGRRSIRLDVYGASLLNGPIRLSYRLSGIASAAPALVSLRRWLLFASSGQFATALHPPHSKAKRQVLLLRTFDAIRAGANQRAIAAELLSCVASELRWRINAPSLRSKVQRLVRDAQRMSEEGFWTLVL